MSVFFNSAFVPTVTAASRTMAHHRRRRDRTEVSCCLKYVIFGFNVIFWVSLLFWFFYLIQSCDKLSYNHHTQLDSFTWKLWFVHCAQLNMTHNAMAACLSMFTVLGLLHPRHRCMGMVGEEHVQQPQQADAHSNGPGICVHHRRCHHIHYWVHRLCWSSARKHLSTGICEYSCSQYLLAW